LSIVSNRMNERILTARELNRALLARQGLIERTDASAAETIERLVGLQAQEPDNPYVALWARLRDFDPAELSDLLESRAAVRGTFMRATIHLLTTPDCLAIHPVTASVREAVYAGSAWRRGLGDDLDAVVRAGTELLRERPRTRAELRRALSERWPDHDPQALAHAVTYNVALVQLPPRGLWGRNGGATWALVEDCLGRPLEPEPSVDDLVLRYLAAFGPATVADIRTWSRLTGLREVVERLRPRLRTFRDERGRELFDVPHAPLPDPDTPAPPRFLPEYDNVWLSHDERARIVGDWRGARSPTGRWSGTLLVDGFCRGNWKLVEEDGVATLAIDRFEPRPSDPPGTAEAVEAEAHALTGFVFPEATRTHLRFGAA
jgi:winged helix DNA-binding protein